METKEFIVASSKKLSTNRSGVYFLIFQGEIVYVGASSNCENRIYLHRRNRSLKFSSYYIIYLDGYKSEQIFEIEKKYIALFRPKHNVKDNPEIFEKHPFLYNVYKKFYNSYSEFAEALGVSETTARNALIEPLMVSKKIRAQVEQHFLRKINSK